MTFLEVPDEIEAYEELGEEVVDITPKPKTDKPSKPRAKKPAKIEEKKIARVKNDKYNACQQTYYVADDTDRTLNAIQRAIEDKGGRRPGKGKLLDEIVATFVGDYLKLKLKSIE